MTKTMLAALCAAMLAAGCGSEDEDAGSNASGLSTAFTNNCAQCHGPTGLGQGKYPRIPGDKDESAFMALVRSGKGEMPPFTASQISDADLRSDYRWLTTERTE